MKFAYVPSTLVCLLFAAWIIYLKFKGVNAWRLKDTKFGVQLNFHCEPSLDTFSVYSYDNVGFLN